MSCAGQLCRDEAARAHADARARGGRDQAHHARGARRQDAARRRGALQGVGPRHQGDAAAVWRGLRVGGRCRARLGSQEPVMARDPWWCERFVAEGGSSMMRGARVIGLAVATAVVACLLGLPLTPPAGANEVVQWNETTMKFIEANGQIAVVSTRTLAMVHGAVHDALNAIDRKYDAYYFEGPADASASPDAAVAAAAHTVLVGLVNSFGTPAQKGAALALAEQAYASS